MTARLDPLAAAPDLMKMWFSASLKIASSLEPSLAQLVEIRASQIRTFAEFAMRLAWCSPTAHGNAPRGTPLLTSWRDHSSREIQMHSPRWQSVGGP